MARALNAETVKLLKQWEGFKANAYPDPGSRDGTPWTIGYGQTRIDGRPVRKGDTITEPAAYQCMKAELDRISAFVARLVKVPTTDNQHGALVSFTYNVGDTAFKNSTLLKKLNAGDYDAVPAQLARWNKNDGKVMQGLVNRRAAEAGLWARGEFVSSNNVPAKPGNPVTDVLTPERITAGGALLGGAAGLAAGSGPVQIALAVALVLAALTLTFIVVRKALH